MTSSVRSRPLSRNCTCRLRGTSPLTWYVGTREEYALRSAQRPGDLPAVFVVVDLTGGAVELPAMLLRPVPDGVVGLEDLRELLVARGHLRERDLAGGQHLLAFGRRHADLDRPVLPPLYPARGEKERG